MRKEDKRWAQMYCENGIWYEVWLFFTVYCICVLWSDDFTHYACRLASRFTQLNCVLKTHHLLIQIYILF